MTEAEKARVRKLRLEGAGYKQIASELKLSINTVKSVSYTHLDVYKRQLRDTTGNRRFWPVKTPGGGIKHSWDLDEYEISQIWAEVLEYVNAGEKLYLDANLNVYAKEEQCDACLLYTSRRRYRSWLPHIYSHQR